MSIRKYIISSLVVSGLLLAVPALATVFLPYQGGTGVSSTPQSGQVLIGNASGTYNPAYLSAGTNVTIATSSGGISISASGGGGGSGVATTTINGAQCPVFTFSIVATNTPSTITTSTCNIFFNLLAYSSGTDINVASNGVINFVNTPGYITTSTVSINGVSGNVFTGLATSTGANPTASIGTSAVNGSANTFMRSDGAPAINQAATFAFSALGNTTSTANISASTINASTSITNQGVKSALVLNNANGLEGGFAGSSCTNQGVSAISATGTVTCTSFATSTGATVAGSSGNIQFNNANSFAATLTFTINSSTGQLNLSGVIISGGLVPTVSGGSVNTSSFISYGVTSTYTVPLGITSITITAKGGSGGCTGGAGETDGGGGTEVGTMTVTPGQVLYIYVAKACGGFGGTSAGGWGQGGDMSWVSTSPTFSTSTVILLAAGGGGGSSGSAGGAAGGLTGSSSASGATGGSQTAGGTGAGGGGNGSAGTGGNGAASNGGGGGAGFFGGGAGGGASSGGAGGSSFATSTLTATSTTSGTTSTNAAASGSVSIYHATSTTAWAITGTNTAGVVTLSSSTLTSSNITFAGTGFASTTNGVGCWIEPINATNTSYCSASTSNASITFQNALTNGQGFYYHFLGY